MVPLALVFLTLVSAQGVAAPALSCRTLVPAYRASVYRSLGLTEGLFEVTLTLPDGHAAVELVGRVMGAGGGIISERTLPGASSGSYRLDWALTDLQPGDITFRAEARLGEQVLASASTVVHVVAPAQREVVLDQAGVLCVNGQRVFPIGICAADGGPLDRLASLGFGLAVRPLDRPAQAGELVTDGRMIAASGAPQDGPARGELAAAPGLGLWLVAADDVTAYEKLVAEDPYHPVMVTAEDPPAAGDVLLLPVDPEAAAAAGERVRRLYEADGYRRPAWVKVAVGNATSVGAARVAALAGALGGACGAVFDPRDGQSPEQLSAQLEALLRELAGCAPVLVGDLADEQARCADGRVRVTTRVVRFDRYVIALNTSGDPLQATFSGLRAGQVTDLATGHTTLAAADGTFTVPLGPQGTVLLSAGWPESEGPAG